MSKKQHLAALALVIVSGGVAGVAMALEPQGYRTAEGLVVTPLLTVRERFDDNLRAVELNPESSFVTTVAPSLELGAKGRKAAFAFTLAAPSYIYHSSHEDDHTDVHLTSMLDLAFDRRNRLGLDAGYHRIEDTASVVQSLQNDRWEASNVGAIYGYGAETARGQVQLGVRLDQVRFRNDLVLPGVGILNADRDRDVSAWFGTLFVGVAPKTKALLEARHTAYDYASNPALNSANQALLAGVSWEATAITRGMVKVGSETKSFERAGVPDQSKAMWEVSVDWSPLTYSTFTLTSNSRLDEGTNGAYVIETQALNLGWKHQWLKRLRSQVSLGSTQQDYVGAPLASGAERADDIFSAGAGLTYAMRRWLDIGLSYSFLQGDSNAPGRSYERNIVALNVDVSM